MEAFWIVLIVLAALFVLLVILAAVVMYMVAYPRQMPAFANAILSQSGGDYNEEDPIEQKHMKMFNEATAWLEAQPNKQDIYITSFDGLKLHAVYVPAEKPTKKTVHVIHGFRGQGLWDFAAMIPYFHEAGYNVNIPDDRAHNASEGKYLGFGWNDRRDTVDWCRKLVEIVGEDAQIALHGVSMGSATVMMAAGEDDLPGQVKCAIADCGFSSVYREFQHTTPAQIKALTPFILRIDSLINRLCNHYWFEQASSIKQLKKAKVPFFFIHGDSDTFVPTAMVYDNYNACASEKELWITKNVPHAKSQIVYPEEYGEKTTAFIEKYFV